ncbi:GntR family transcriptional regulator [Rhizobium sp. NPDC090275]|uniref:GntR family transcriptional regulator n=1 Tax=Rhizobium sp. NPDC090275 TaxID=3364498 RepID=UPI00383A7EB6
MRPVRKQTFREQIVEELRGAIMNGQLPPGSAVVESDLAVRFGVSRGPLREALRHLIEEGLLVTVPYTGTHVISLSVEDIHEIFSLRTELEIFAFKLIWENRTPAFSQEMIIRHERLLNCIDSGNDEGSIKAELALHSYVYEACGHKILFDIWRGLRGKLQLYWAAHHRAHERRGPKRESHDNYVRLAMGADFGMMTAEIRGHMLQGFERTEAFLMDVNRGANTSLVSR